MIERRIDSFDFYSAMDHLSDRLFHVEGKGLDRIYILVRDDGVETEAIMPIEEYRRLRRLASRARKAPRTPRQSGSEG